MDNLKIFCMCLDADYLKVVKKLNYIPVGLKNKNFSKDWLLDNTLMNISEKNPYYGEYTFYYWYWKNMLKHKKENDWIGFCSYRELWGDKKASKNKDSIDSVLQHLPNEWDGYEAIIGKPFFLERPKLSKILKYGKISALRNFKEILKSRFSIKFQFDMYHGNGILEKAIDQLPTKDKEDFTYYVNNEVSLNQGNMFISNSSSIINMYFDEVFTWLKKCEKILGFDLKGYRKIRIYTFLAERFLPYWFKKYTKYLEWPVVYYDINKKID
jgi:hypothetical protein